MGSSHGHALIPLPVPVGEGQRGGHWPRARIVPQEWFLLRLRRQAAGRVLSLAGRAPPPLYGLEQGKE